MKSIIFITIIIVILFFPTSQVKPQNMDSLYLYYPMQIGNKWEYNYGSAWYGDSVVGHRTIEIVGDTIMPNGNRYFVFRNFFLSNPSYQRSDSGQILWYFNTTDNPLFFTNSSTYNDTIFGLSVPMINTHTTGSRDCRLAYGIGIIYEYCWDVGDVPPYTEWYSLTYARVNGKEFGKLTSVTINLTQPNHFALYQNYPNPFNPSTAIRFFLPNSDYCTIKVFNILGQEVKTVYSELTTGGFHEVTFDGQNISTGIYFYRLQTNGFTSTKTMILAK